MPPLLDDFIHNRVCKLKCEKFLTRPNWNGGDLHLKTKRWELEINIKARAFGHALLWIDLN